MGRFGRITAAVLGERAELPESLARKWPELGELRYRRGGLAPRVAGWLVGSASVAAVTLGRTVFLGRRTRPDPELLLHELRHVQQYSERRIFPLHYIWESLVRGYHANRFEAEARRYAALRMAGSEDSRSDEDA